MKKLVVVLTVIMFMFVGESYAGHHNRRHGYNGGAALGGFILGAAIVTALQPRYEIVYVPGYPMPYYVNNGIYHQRDIYGNFYPVVVPVVVQPQVIYIQAPQITQTPVPIPAPQIDKGQTVKP